MSEQKQPTRVQLETEVVSSVTAETASQVTGIPRSTLRDRSAPRNQDGTYSLPTLVAWLVAEITDERVTPPGGSSPELERWRKIRADHEAVEFAERLGALTVAGVDAERERRTFTILQQWATDICGDHPGILARYLHACRRALAETARTMYPSGCDVTLRISPTDGSDAFDIPLGTTENDPVFVPTVEEWPEVRICPNCSGELWPSWEVGIDGEETPIWFCRETNCKTNRQLNKIPRHVEESDE